MIVGRRKWKEQKFNKIYEVRVEYSIWGGDKSMEKNKIEKLALVFWWQYYC